MMPPLSITDDEIDRLVDATRASIDAGLRRMNGLFVTATDTGVGKTWVACALARAAVRRGLRVATMKPCETGDGDDGARLLEAAGRPLDPSLARPYRFHLPASPEVAARAEGAAVDPAHLAHCYAQLAADSRLHDRRRRRRPLRPARSRPPHGRSRRRASACRC